VKKTAGRLAFAALKQRDQRVQEKERPHGRSEQGN